MTVLLTPEQKPFWAGTHLNKAQLLSLLAQAAALQFRYLSDAAQEHPLGHGFALLAFSEELWDVGELVCTSQSRPEELFSFLRRSKEGSLAVLLKTASNARRLSALAPFTADYPVPEIGAQYYLCKDRSCRRVVIR